jgi:hypothetical protein
LTFKLLRGLRASHLQRGMERGMAEPGDAGSAAARLEAALERIAQAAARPPSVEYVTGAPDPADGEREQALADLVVARERELAEAAADHQRMTESLTGRLDALIGELRGALGKA